MLLRRTAHKTRANEYILIFRMDSKAMELQKELIGKYIQAPITDQLRRSIEEGPPADESNSIAKDFYGTQTYNPLFDYIWKTHSSQAGQWFGSEWRISKYSCKDNDSILEKNIAACAAATAAATAAKVSTRKADVFRKVIHILSPTAILENVYSMPKTPGLPWHTRPSYAAFNKINSPFNQAYIDNFGSYLAGRLVERKISPHFVPYYGAVTTMSKTYMYNITEDYQSYRKESWFWDGVESKSVNFHIMDGDGNAITDPKIVHDIVTRPSSSELTDGASLDLDESDKQALNVIDMTTIATSNGEVDTLDETDCLDMLNDMTLDTVDMNNMGTSDCEVDNESPDDTTTVSENTSETDDEEDTEDTEEEDDIHIYLEFKDMPTMMVFFERQDGNMDDLLYDDEEVGAKCGTKSWDDRWTAWIFQVIVALTQLQAVYGMTHNDLHTNNIVWTATEQTHILYKRKNGSYMRVPTYGKIFRVIDFGRAIISVGDRHLVSDDYMEGGDAGGQYNFGPIYDPAFEEIEPNLSFDLCRLAISCIEGLFPQFPVKRKEKPVIMSKEEGRVMWETTSPLFNMLWRWVLTDSGENLLLDNDNNERYPSFDLYLLIAAQVHGAVPAKQLENPVFRNYIWNGKVKGHVYPMYA